VTDGVLGNLGGAAPTHDVAGHLPLDGLLH
jgi:hypothetical protein